MLDLYAGMDSCMLAQQVEQAASVDEFQRLVLGEVVGVYAVAAGANQDGGWLELWWSGLPQCENSGSIKTTLHLGEGLAQKWQLHVRT